LFGLPPVGSPKKRARVEWSTSAAKFPAAENVTREVRIASFPGRFTARLLRAASSEP
jgi:hypothetical protein